MSAALDELKGKGAKAPRTPAKVWLAYHDDWSGMAVFSSEITCLRYAQQNGMRVLQVAFGVDLREAVLRR